MPAVTPVSASFMKGALQQALAQIARDGVERVDPAAVETVARVIWHTDDVVDFDMLEGQHRDDVIRLVARLSAFSAVSRERKSLLLGQAREALGIRGDQAVLSDDRVAHTFIERFWAQLAPLQTHKVTYAFRPPARAARSQRKRHTSKRLKSLRRGPWSAF